MNRGCIATGEIKCDICQSVIEQGGRYLLREEEAEKLRLCIDCCLDKGYASHVKEKDEQVITFFPPKVDS